MNLLTSNLRSSAVLRLSSQAKVFNSSTEKSLSNSSVLDTVPPELIHFLILFLSPILLNRAESSADICVEFVISVMISFLKEGSS